MSHIIRILLTLNSLILSTGSWNLSNFNISSNYYISSITTYGNRAFLSLPRSACMNDISNPTVVEVSWYSEQNFFFRRKPFFMDFQTWGECNHLQDAIFLDSETMRPRLWVLDKGSPNCPPKIVIYNLFHKINYSVEAPDNFKDKFSQLIVDSDVKTNGPIAYVGLEGLNYLLVFSLSEFKWRRINLRSTNNLLPISTTFLAFSRKEDILYLTGSEERAIFSLDLSQLKEDNEEANVTFIGEKLGDSSGLVADFKDGLIYYLTRDYAIVRWDTRYPSEAEFYNILGQSYEILPFVSQLYTDPQNGIWAIVNYGPSTNCETPSFTLKKRLVKILKYNILL